jgi:outer membrane protein
MLRWFGLASIVLGAVVPSAALAQSQPQPGYWTVMLGGEGRVTPRWQGASDKYIFFPTPFLDIRKAGTPEPLYGARDGFGIALINEGGWRFGPVGKIRLPRREDKDYNSLRGLGDVNTAYEVGAFVDYYFPGRWLRTRLELRQGWGGHDGFAADLTADFIGRVTPRFQVSGGPRISFASAAATSPYFSITPAQSATSGLPVYDAKGGVRSLGAGAQARYHWTPQWATHVFVEYEKLQGDAKNSPLITQRGSADQWTMGFGLTYEFNMKSLW